MTRPWSRLKPLIFGEDKSREPYFWYDPDSDFFNWSKGMTEKQLDAHRKNSNRMAKKFGLTKDK